MELIEMLSRRRDQMSTEQRRTALSLAAIGGVLAITVIAAAVAAIGYTYWTSPQRSVRAITTAVHEHDWESFSKFVDVDAIAENAVEYVSDGDVPAFAASSLRERAAQTLREVVESGDPRAALPDAFGVFKRPGLHLTEVGAPRMDGALAMVPLTFREGSHKPTFAVLQMRRAGMHWQAYRFAIGSKAENIRLAAEYAMNP